MRQTEKHEMPRKRPGIVARLFHGTGAGAVGYVLGIATNLLLLPLYLRTWSVAVYGEWMALYSVVNYLGTLDFGVTTAAVNAATIAHAREDWHAFKRNQGTAWAASLVIAGFGAIVIVLLATLYFHIDSWLGLKTLSHRESRLVVLGLAVALLANIPGRQLTSIFVAVGEFAKSQWLTNAYAFFTFVVTACALVLGAGPIELAMVLAATALGTIAFSFFLVMRGGGRLVPHLRDADWATARELAAPTGQVGLSMFASALTVQGPVIVLSRMLGGPAVALFTTTRTVTNAVRAVIVLMRAPLRPEFAAAAAQARYDALRRLFRIAVSVDTVIALSLSAALWSGGLWLIHFWSRGHIPPDSRLLHLLLIAVVFEGFLQILTTVGWATNKIKDVSLGLIATSSLSLIVAVLLVGRFGPSAIPIGMLVLLIVVMMPIALRNAVHQGHIPVHLVVGRILVPFVGAAAVSLGIATWFGRLEALPWWLATSFATLAAFATALLVCGFALLDQGDRKDLYERIVGQLGKKSTAGVAARNGEEGLGSAQPCAETNAAAELIVE